jgi:hypothetical protein
MWLEFVPVSLTAVAHSRPFSFQPNLQDSDAQNIIITNLCSLDLYSPRNCNDVRLFSIRTPNPRSCMVCTLRPVLLG